MKIIKLQECTLVLHRMVNYTVNHQSGWAQIPHACIKVHHENGYAWFGVNMIPEVNDQVFDKATIKYIEKEIRGITDVVSILTDLERLTKVLANGSGRTLDNVIFDSTSDIAVRLTMPNNVRLTLYREGVEIEESIMGKGGFVVTIHNKGETLEGFVHHRAIVLPNYVDELQVKQHVLEGLNKAFPDNFQLGEDDVNVNCTIEANS